MAAQNQDFITYQGDSVQPIFTVKDASGVVVNIASVTEIVWKLRRNLDSGILLTKTKSGGQIVLLGGGTTGQFQVSILVVDTAALSGYYLHSASITDGSGNVTTVTVGRVQVGQPPAWTYDPTQLDTNTTYQVRDLIGDVKPGDPQLYDGEINRAIALWSNSIYLAAAECCRKISTRYAREVNITQGQLTTAYGQKAAAYAKLAVDLTTVGYSRGGGVGGYAGGISIEDKRAVEADTDRVQPQFVIGMEDNYLPVSPVGNEVPGGTAGGAEQDM